MTQFKYTGPVTVLGLRGRPSVNLVNGTTYELPADAGAVRTLVAKGYLAAVTPVVPATPATPAAPVTDEAPKKGRAEK